MSWSQKVKTVSRCIAARSRGICAPITSRAAPASNILRARMLTALAVLRSPIPDQDDAVADRHHVAALHPRGAPVVVGASEPDLEVRIAEARMEAVDRLDVQRLELAGRPEHRVEARRRRRARRWCRA